MPPNEAVELIKGNVIPDVLPHGTKYNHQLTVKWPTATLEISGKELDREATQPEPTLWIEPEVTNIPVLSANSLLTSSS